ncbi:MAG: MipA/OmpV family protein [Roseateles sp.]|uniref:MipA/OmpV family protein n=1 Tax=Roseateles sp. TaxID=1971397 RepID=UPI0039EAB91A
MSTAPLPVLLAAAALALTAVPARAGAPQQDAKDDGPPARYVLGLSLASVPEYEGARRRDLKLRPVWAARIGRLRLATGGGSALLGFGREGAGAGASTALIEGERLRVGVSLSLDGGRDSGGDAGTTRGLPDVRRTLRAKLYASYSLARDWTVGAAVSQDVLGRQGGLTMSLDTGWRFFRSETTEWSAGIGVSAANAQNLRSYFGVPDSAVAASGKPAYRPGAGLRDVHAGLGVRHALSRHWFVFGGVGTSRLLGPAARSPLVERPGGMSAAVGVAWRN